MSVRRLCDREVSFTSKIAYLKVPVVSVYTFRAESADRFWSRIFWYYRKCPNWCRKVGLRVINQKYFENFYGALSLYFWAFEATLESEYVSSQNADFNLWNVLTQIFRQKLKKSSEKDSLSFYSKRKLSTFDSFHPYIISRVFGQSEKKCSKKCALTNASFWPMPASAMRFYMTNAVVVAISSFEEKIAMNSGCNIFAELHQFLY